MQRSCQALRCSQAEQLKNKNAISFCPLPKKIKNPEVWDKVFIYDLHWAPVPNRIYPQTISKWKKERHTLSILLRTEQRTAVLGAGHTGSFPLSYTFPRHRPPSPCHHPRQLSMTAGCGGDFAVPWASSHPTEAAMGTGACSSINPAAFTCGLAVT